MSGTDLTILVALAAGVISFLSPCVLPLVPAYLGQLTAIAVAATAIAVSWPRYAGTSGRTHGERKLITPAASATRIVRSVPDIGQPSSASCISRRSFAALVASSRRDSPISTTGIEVN